MQEGRGSPSGTYERQAIWLMRSRSVSRGHMYEWPHDTWEMKELMCNMKGGGNQVIWKKAETSHDTYTGGCPSHAGETEGRGSM